MKSYKVNICMVTFNRLDYTKQSLENVISTASKKIPFMMTVIDNGSTDGTVEYLKQLHIENKITNLILLDENIGVAKAQNLGWKLFESDADIYGKIDNDIIFEKNFWLDGIVEILDNVPKIGAIGYNCEDKHYLNDGKDTNYPLYKFNNYQFRVKKGNVGGACFFVSKEVHDLLGVWCEDYNKYGEEDADFGVRISHSNLYNCYMPDEDVMIHLPETNEEYKKFKDDQRDDNLEGPFRKNYRLYQKKLKELKIDTNIDKTAEYTIVLREN